MDFKDFIDGLSELGEIIGGEQITDADLEEAELELIEARRKLSGKTGSKAEEEEYQKLKKRVKERKQEEKERAQEIEKLRHELKKEKLLRRIAEEQAKPPKPK